MNLSEYVKKPFIKEAAYFDMNGFNRDVRIAIEALNDVLLEGLPLHPLEIQRQTVNDWRQIGLGIMGLGDALIKLGLKYGDEKSLRLCDAIGFNMANSAIETSSSIASKQGYYPKYKQEVIFKSKYFSENADTFTKKTVKDFGLAHSQLLTIAPTGSLSTMLGISGGIEPIYNISYNRKTQSLHEKEVTYKVYTPIAEEYMKIHNIKNEEDLPDYFITAMNLNYKDRINMQSVWQKHIDASISSTVNVPNGFTVNEVKDLYLYAWEKGLKGVTIYRDNCARSGILTNTKEEKRESVDNKKIELSRGTIIEVDDSLVGHKRKLQTGCGSLHVEAFFSPDTGDMMEVYLSKGSTGGCNSFMVGLSRLISTSLRGGIPLETIVDQLDSVLSCPSYAVRNATKHDTSKGKCCPDAIGRALLEMQMEMWQEVKIEDEEELSIKTDEIDEEIINDSNLSDEELQYIQDNGEIAFAKRFNKCPICGDVLKQEGGCVSCDNDGWSRCD